MVFNKVLNAILKDHIAFRMTLQSLSRVPVNGNFFIYTLLQYLLVSLAQCSPSALDNILHKHQGN